jgi:phospholipid/cholesterol/gamma-HCH transport system substrate-binding protein
MVSVSPSPADEAIPNIELKAAALLVLLLALVFSSIAYVMYARGLFESTQRLVLIADDSEGVTVGMDLTFSGFAIGRVRRTELGPDGKVRILIDVASKDAKWVRTSSVFTMERGVVGETRLRAFSGILSDPPLPDGAERTVLRGDITAEIPRLLGTVRALVDNLEHMTKEDSSLNASLGNLQTLTTSLRGRYGVLGVALGNDANAQKVISVLDRANAVLARIDGTLAKADDRVFGPQGVVDESRAAAVQLNAMLADVRASLTKVDAVLVEAQAIGANARVASTDLGALRAQVETSLRKVESLVNEINRKWPFARDTELRLP